MWKFYCPIDYSYLINSKYWLKKKKKITIISPLKKEFFVEIQTAYMLNKDQSFVVNKPIEID